jgi:class 3 adenylate cyclase
MHKDSIVAGLSHQIRKSTKLLTILVTDIEGSTEYFDERGDIESRLMVDQHNRVAFPVITRFRGKIIKTTGDGVMASFRVPANAIRAAIGIQQLLAQQRDHNPSTCPHVRIAIHTGQTIVEHKDLYGDAVNVAVRLTDQGKGDEILVSEKTVAELQQEEFRLRKNGEFRPRGKTTSLTIYRCRWAEHRNLIGNILIWSFLPIVKLQKTEILIYSVASVGILYFLYLNYLRYLIADHKYLALVSLNPQLILDTTPAIPAILLMGTIAAAAVLYVIRVVPYSLLRLMKGGFGFCIAFLTLYVAVTYLPMPLLQINGGAIYRSHHLFVEVLRDTRVHQFPSSGSQVLRDIHRGDLLLLADVAKRGDLTWNKVLVRKEQYGWVPRVLPPTIGEPERRVTLAYKFSFRYSDLGALLAGFAGFAWGFLNLRIRPT